MNASLTVQLTDVVFDPTIYPRAEWSRPTAARYADAIEAGEVLPPIILESGSNRLLDGKHRFEAYVQLGRDSVEVEFHGIPDGIPAKLYAASLSARHGDRIPGEDMRGVAREVVEQNPNFSMETVARMLGITRQTVGRWCSDITERRRSVRKVRALLLSHMGWTNVKIADALGVTHPVVGTDLKEMSDVTSLSEDVLRDALEGLPAEAADVAERIREERIFADWSDDERDLLDRLRGGETVVVSLRDNHANLVKWATEAGMFVRVDRRTAWGNPFEMPDDGDRGTVIENYRVHYLPHKPSLAKKVSELQGKAIGCWCAPAPCHADVLKAWADQ